MVFYLNCFKYPMKKILTGFLGLFLVIGIVAGAGYALFSSKATITGMVLGTATPSLQVWNGSTWVSEIDLAGDTTFFAPLLPGEMDWSDFYLKNESNGTFDKLDFTVTGKIKSAAGDWYALKDVVRARICIYSDTDANHCDTTKTSEWFTLDEWYTAEHNLPGNPLEQGEQARYSIVLSIDSSYTNTIAGKTITGLNFEFTGTQVLE